MFKEFQHYTPPNKILDSAVYIRCNEGEDWYDLVPLFREDTLKFVLDADGVIRDLNVDASRLWPLGFSVIEIALTEVPAEIIDGNPRLNWRYADGVFSTTHKIEKLKKKKLLAEAENTIAPLSRAARLKIATDDELAQLDEWEKYSVLVSRVDVQDAPDITWPEKP